MHVLGCSMYCSLLQKNERGKKQYKCLIKENLFYGIENIYSTAYVNSNVENKYNIY